MRINASLVRTGPQSQVPLAADLRSQALAEVRSATGETRSRRYLYEDLVSRDHAARGVVVGQYVRIAQAEHAIADDPSSGPTLASVDAGFLRRDLIDSMFRQMTGAGCGGVTGQCLVTTV